MFLIKLILGISTKGYYQFDMTKPQLDLRTLNNVKFRLLSYWIRTSIKLNSKLQMFPIKLILGISTEGYYQFNMTKPQLNLRTSNNVKFWLLSYRFRMSLKLKLNWKLQMFPIKLILGILIEGYYQFVMTKPQIWEHRMMSNLDSFHTGFGRRSNSNLTQYCKYFQSNLH